MLSLAPGDKVWFVKCCCVTQIINFFLPTTFHLLPNSVINNGQNIHSSHLLSLSISKTILTYFELLYHIMTRYRFKKEILPTLFIPGGYFHEFLIYRYSRLDCAPVITCDLIDISTLIRTLIFNYRTKSKSYYWYKKKISSFPFIRVHLFVIQSFLFQYNFLLSFIFLNTGTV